MMLINDGVHQWLKSEYMQLINKNEHARVTIYGWKLHDRSDIGEYGTPSRVGPRANCPSCPPSRWPWIFFWWTTQLQVVLLHSSSLYERLWYSKNYLKWWAIQLAINPGVRLLKCLNWISGELCCIHMQLYTFSI